jgi:hypothetical protein
MYNKNKKQNDLINIYVIGIILDIYENEYVEELLNIETLSDIENFIRYSHRSKIECINKLIKTDKEFIKLYLIEKDIIKELKGNNKSYFILSEKTEKIINLKRKKETIIYIPDNTSTIDVFNDLICSYNHFTKEENSKNKKTVNEFINEVNLWNDYFFDDNI